MSGFWGIVRAAEQTSAWEEDRRTLERTARQFVFPGEAAPQVWFQDGACFCFSPFRTGPAPQSAMQPVCLGNHTWLIGDLRLDGRDDLISRLKALGESCDATTTDEELVLRAWHCWGESGEKEILLGALQGNFGFVLWQPEKHSVTCFRDLMGSRPFFYSRCGARFCFSNRLEALLGIPWISRELDYRYLGDYLLCGWCLNPERTAYRAIKRLPPGHTLTFSGDEPAIRRFSKLPIEAGFRRRKDEEYIEEYRFLLSQAVKERTPTGGTAVFMSGGLDSTMVAATASQVLREQNAPGSLRAITTDYQPLFDDRESEWAGIAGKHIGIPLQVLHGGEYLPFADWEKLRVPLAEPRHEPCLVLILNQYREAAQHARVAITGNGGDDILLGNAWPYFRYLLSRLQLGQIVKSFGGYFLRHGKFPHLRMGIRTRLRGWLGVQSAEQAYPPWLNPKYEKEYGLKERWRELHKKPEEEHPLHPAGYALLSGPFWPSVLEGENIFRAHAAIETRAPLLDSRLLRFLLRVPPVPWCADKELLRKAATGFLPEEIRLRPKSPLKMDSVRIQIAWHKWSPLPTEPVMPLLRDLIDEQAWIRVLKSEKNCEESSNHFPLSLNLWLKGIEKGRVIQ